MSIFQTNVAPSPIPDEEDKDSNNDAGLGIEDDEETESDIVLPRPAAEQRSKNNHDHDEAQEGAIRGTKRPIPLNKGESSSKAAALSPSHGKVAPMKQRKTLSTLGGRKVSTSTDVAKGSKKSSESGSAQAALVAVAPPRRALKTARK